MMWGVILFLLCLFLGWIKIKYSYLNNNKHNNPTVPIVYDYDYNFGFGFGIQYFHPFDINKYYNIVRFLITKGVVPNYDAFHHIPHKVSDITLLTVHSSDYIYRTLKNKIEIVKILEILPLLLFPCRFLEYKILNPMKYATQGTILATHLAIKNKKWAINIGGGYHHSSGLNGGSGFCVYADIQLAILAIKQSYPDLIQSVMIVDCDAHRSNGIEEDKLNGLFNGLNVYIMDMYNPNIFMGQPSRSHQAIDIDIRITAFITDKGYLQSLDQNLAYGIDKWKPNLIIYNAGTDILMNDPLGALNITADGIIKRDEIVFQHCLTNHIPVVMLLSGGYQTSNAKIIADSIENIYTTFQL